MSKASYMLGVIAGIIAPGEIGKEPVAWLYNGVRLPKLPEWDRETYPYAVIGLASGYDTYWLACVSGTPIVSSANTVFFEGWDGLTNILFYAENGEWVSDSRLASFSDTLWTNQDLFYSSDGTLFLAASEPVPVYE